LLNSRLRSPTVDEIAEVIQDVWWQSPPILGVDGGGPFDVKTKRERWRQWLRS